MREMFNEYCVNMENSICSCVGLQGASCKHQYLVVKGEKLASTDFINKADNATKLLLYSILTDRRKENGNWYNLLHKKRECSKQNKVEVNHDEGETNNVESENMLMQKKEDIECAKQNLKENLKGIFSEFETLIVLNPTKFMPALTKLSDSYYKCKSISSMLSALRFFGPFVRVDALIKKSKNLQCRKKILVQSTAGKRRKVYLGDRLIQQSEKDSCF